MGLSQVLGFSFCSLPIEFFPKVAIKHRLLGTFEYFRNEEVAKLRGMEVAFFSNLGHFSQRDRNTEGFWAGEGGLGQLLALSGLQRMLRAAAAAGEKEFITQPGASSVG